MKIIVFEGIDGCGKSTIAQQVHKILSLNYRTALIAFPTTSPEGRHVRQILNAKTGFNDEELAEAFVQDFNSLFNKLKKMRDEYDIIILDRYYWSFKAYQSNTIGKLKTDEYFYKINTAKIDIGFILYAPIKCAMQRLDACNKKKDNMEARGADFFQKVQDSFLRIQKDTFGAYYLDATKSIEELTDIVLGILSITLKIHI